MLDFVGMQPIPENPEPMFRVSYDPEPPTYESVVTERMTTEDRTRFFSSGADKYKVEFFYDGCAFALGILEHTYPTFTIAGDHIKEVEDKMNELLVKYYGDKRGIKILYVNQLKTRATIVVDDDYDIERFRELVIPIYKNPTKSKITLDIS